MSKGQLSRAAGIALLVAGLVWAVDIVLGLLDIRVPNNFIEIVTYLLIAIAAVTLGLATKWAPLQLSVIALGVAWVLVLIQIFTPVEGFTWFVRIVMVVAGIAAVILALVRPAGSYRWPTVLLGVLSIVFVVLPTVFDGVGLVVDIIVAAALIVAGLVLLPSTRRR